MQANNDTRPTIDLPADAPEIPLRQVFECAHTAGLDAQLLKRNLALVSEAAFARGCPAKDAVFWQRALGAEAVQHFLQIADVADDLCELSFEPECYLEFSRSGKREAYELFLVRKSRFLCALAISECTLADGHHLDELARQLHQWLQMPTWIAPAHDGRLDNFNGSAVLVDLASSTIAYNLAITCLWLENRLPPELIEQVRTAVYRRAIKPYLDDLAAGTHENTWWRTAPHNWNAVCHAGVLGALLALPARAAEKALLLTAAETAIRQSYLGSFSADGYCPEGLGYWNYGFGQFMATALLLRDYTADAIRWDELAPAAMIGNFPADYQLHDGIFPTFCDCYPANNRIDSVNGRMARELFHTKLKPDYEYSSGQWSSSDSWHSLGYRLSLFARSLQQYTNNPELFRQAAGAGDIPSSSSFTQAQVYVARCHQPGRLKFSFAAKGGSNSPAQNHNQNDLGSWVAALGQSLLLVDPGMDVYSPANFDERRYHSSVNNSYGHPVPVVDGKLQSTGEQFYSTVLEAKDSTEVFTLSLDLRTAYDVAGLEALVKDYRFSRSENPALRVSDRFTAAHPVSFETCVLTFSNARVEGNAVWVWNGTDILRISPESPQGPPAIRLEQLQSGRMQPLRIGFSLPERATEGFITLTITPEDALPFA